MCSTASTPRRASTPPRSPRSRDGAVSPASQQAVPQKPCPPPDPAPSTPRIAMPADACDTHAHIFGPAAKYAWNPARGYTPPDALPAAYEHLHRVLGVTRAVITQPSVYGIDNAATLDYVAADLARRRAVVSVGADVTDRELAAMHDRGARGIRVNIADPGGNPFKSFAELRAVAERLKPMGWHIELLLHVDQADLDELRALPVDISIGHFGYMPAAMGVDHPKYRAFLDLVGEGHCWVKLTGPYRITARQQLPYDDTVPFARALVARRPDRIVWGTDWPHPMCPVPMPNDGTMADMLLDWVPDEAVRKRILVDNAAALYGF
ncbi:MAG: amidohydrolase family protein [Proteobacteria bacterium]|nr:amidohydrolase family protein [Pseudomonadota bacterium]